MSIEPRRRNREFRPSVGSSRLEGRMLLSGARAGIKRHAAHIRAVRALQDSTSTGTIRSQTGRGGEFVRIFDSDGDVFDVTATNGGLVRAEPMSKGRVRLILEATSPRTVVQVDPRRSQREKGSAHTFGAASSTKGDHILHIGEIVVQTGQIFQFLGFKTANLSGPFIVAGTNPVDRIALESILPGTTIRTGGDINTLDVYNRLRLSPTDSITVGRDLNLLNVGSDLTLVGGSTFIVNRDMGLVTQPAKGTGTGSNVLQETSGAAQAPLVSAYIQGNMIIQPGAAFIVRRSIDQLFFIQGGLVGASRFSPFVNVVALGGAVA